MARRDAPSSLLFGTPAALESATIPPDAAACDWAGLKVETVPIHWDPEAVVAALSEAVPCGVLLYGRNGELHAVNSHFAEAVGYDRDGLLALGCFEKLVEALARCFADPEMTAERWRWRQQAGEPCLDELEMISPSRKHLERFGRPIVDARGRRSGWMEVYRDVSGQKLSQGNLFRIERMVTLGQLVSSVAHELNNPLTSIACYAQLLRRRRQTSQGAEDVEHILQETERVAGIVRSLLQFGRGARPERSAVDLNEIVCSVSISRAAELAQGQITIRLELAPELPLVLGDAAQLHQVLLNLLVNSEQAIKQAQDQGSICVRTRRLPGNRLAVDVIDDGPGIPPESLPRIFDPFYTTKPAGVGTGLGLSIACGIAQDHAGSISVESRPGGGAAFTVELPVAPAPPLAVSALPGYTAKGRPDSGAPPGARARHESILVIEDEPAVAQLIADVLTEEGHLTEVALDSREGVALIDRKTYGLVLCDLRMPHLSGRRLFQDLQRRNHYLCRRFIFVTGDALSQNAAPFLKRSGVPCLAKPFLIDELKEIVQRTLRCAQAMTPSAAMRAGAACGRGAPQRRHFQ